MSRSPAVLPSGAALVVSPDPAIVTTIERFAVPASRQAEAAEAALRHIAETWKGDRAFVGAALLRGRAFAGSAPSGIACYAQWRRPAGGGGTPMDVTAGDPPDAPGASQSLVQALPAFAMTDSRTYSVEFTAHAAAVDPPTLVSAEQTPCAHFGVFRVARDRQNRMIDRARAHAPDSLSTPGLRTINFHRSLDGLQVVNLGTWVDFDGFASLLQRPGFRDDNLYWQGVADFEPAFFDVVAVDVRP